MEIGVNKNFKESYNIQYSSESKEWRHLGARKKVENILNITNGLVFDRVLEVGAGDGSILELLGKHEFAQEFHAVEISETGLTQIQSKNIFNLKSAQLFDGYHIPFQDKYFDLVILTHVLEHVEHERLLLKEIRRITKTMVIEVPKDYRFGADKKLEHFLSYGHINLYTPTSLKYLLLTENFRIIKQITGLYHIDSFTFGNISLLKKIKGKIAFLTKKALTSLPFPYINDKFINTITLLVESGDKEIRIY